jgi:hypothetical protein
MKRETHNIRPFTTRAPDMVSLGESEDRFAFNIFDLFTGAFEIQR